MENGNQAGEVMTFQEWWDDTGETFYSEKQKDLLHRGYTIGWDHAKGKIIELIKRLEKLGHYEEKP